MRYLLFFFLVSCGQNVQTQVDKTPKKQPLIHDSYFDPILNRFINFYKQLNNNKDLSGVYINFGDVNNGTGMIAYCEISDGWPHVVIGESFWKQSPEGRQEQILFHELGHCLLNRPHDNSTFEDKRPKSIMHSSLIKDSLYELYHNEYIEELFN